MSSLHTSSTYRLSFDIFCRVIDNYGDIGVCWRLARQLARHYPAHDVRLWVDDLISFQRLEPGVDPDSAHQSVLGITIVHWHHITPALPPHDIVIEAFGCELPPDFITAMVDKNSLWLNLEYLSAETWVSRFHLQPSIQANGLRKYFFFPGFSPDTGGLLREPDLVARRQAWSAHPAQRHALFQSCGVSAADIDSTAHGTQVIFLFCYRHAPVSALIRTLSYQAHRSLVLIPQGMYPDATSTPDNKVIVHHIPFVRQDQFDHLLWSADLNIVRGEDSLVRAHWAARPMIWQPYPQDDGIHMIKLNAWLARSPLSPDTRALIRSWTAGDDIAFSDLLSAHLQSDMWSHWNRQAQQWTDTLLEQSGLAESIVRFCTSHG